MTDASRILAAIVRAARGAGSVVVVIALVVIVTLWVANRNGRGAAADPTSPPIAAAMTQAPQATPTPGLPSTEPAVDPAVDPTAIATPDPTAEPTERPTPTPTPKPTPTPTKRPATPKPTHDPAPEPTPIKRSASGSFGQTLAIDGIKAVISPRSPSNDPLIRCGTSDDPERQGFTEIVSFDLRMTWPDASDATEPYIAVGSTPYNVLWFEPQGRFKSGVDYVFSTCKRPADSVKVKIEVAPNGDPQRTYRWYFD